MKDSNIFGVLAFGTVLTLWIASNFTFVSEKQAKADQLESEAPTSIRTLCNGMKFKGSNNGAIKANQYLKSQGRC